MAHVHYLILNAKDEVVVPEQVVSGTNPTEVADIQGPKAPGAYRLKLWLEDSVGFQGQAAEVAIPHDTTPPAAPQELHVAGQTSRWAEKVDLRWSNIGDEGSPIDAAHYQVLDGAGKVVVDTQTAKGDGVSQIADIQAPDPSGDYALKLWLQDEEGNAGAPATVPLSYECARSPVGGGANLSAGLSEGTVRQGQGSTLKGALRQSSGAPVAGAPLCVFEQIEGEDARHYLGLAYTDAAGDYTYAIAPGPNRALRAVYRPGNRRLVAQADLKTTVKPTLSARKSAIRNGQVAHLEGQIPGPRNDDVVIVLQARQGKGWLAFRRYRTRGGGHFAAAYRFRRTTRPTTYEFRAQLRETGGYPYLQGESDPVGLKVVPKGWRPRHRRASASKRCARVARALRRRPGARGLRRRARHLCARAHRKGHRRHVRRRAG